MSVIIRLQNLPWSANALDIRQFFRGLSIPEGGVHIVGGEMGDAFIAFSTDEDARQAMMHDREAINGVQIRLLLSSRAEMQKVIETARQQSLIALKKATALNQPKASPTAAIAVAAVPQKNVAVPQPPVITASSFQNILTNSSTIAATPSFLAYQQQAGFTLIPDKNSSNSIVAVKSDSDDSDSRHSRDRRGSSSRERRRSKSRSRERNVFRRRRDRSRERSRERDWQNNRKSSRHRSRSRERSRGRSRDRSRDHERSRNNNRDNSRRNSRDSISNGRTRSGRDDDTKMTKTNPTQWSVANSYQATTYNTTDAGPNSFIKMSNYQASFNKVNPLDVNKLPGNGNKTLETTISGVSVTAVNTNIQNYNVVNPSLTALNNYSLSSILNTGGNSNDSFKAFALQNPYTTAKNASNNNNKSQGNTASCSSFPGIFVEKNSEGTNVPVAVTNPVSNSSLTQEPIAFANVNPYEQMYPNLFAQAAALSGGGQKSSATNKSSTSVPTSSPVAEDSSAKQKETDLSDTNCVKISNMYLRTSYSDLRKFFSGLFIPHNGIKILNDKFGSRIGIAYVQFSRQSSVTKALCRNNSQLKGKCVIIEAVSEEEFNEAEDSFRPLNQDKAYSQRSNDSDNENTEGSSAQDNNSGFSSLNPYKKMIQLEPFNVIYIEDIPSLATEQDIMKMFSSYSLYDILLIASPENRREFVAHVRFSREEDAKSAYEDRAHHQIGYRRVRMRPGSIEEMENAKEKIRLANEQLMKEEKAAEEEETKRKLEKLITEHIEQEENKQKQQLQHQQQNIIMDLTEDDNEGDEDLEDNDVIETTENPPPPKINKKDGSEMMDNIKLESSKNDIYSQQKPLNKFNSNLDPRRPQIQPNIPSLFDIDTLRNQQRGNVFNDPRLRNISERVLPSSNSPTGRDQMDHNQNGPQQVGANNNSNINNFNPNFNNQQQQQQINPTIPTNSMENNFVILKNCDYNTRINDVAQLLLTANLALKHIEPLRNERQLPSGEFIVEFRRNNDAEIAVQRFHNIPFRNRSLRVFTITPQEIADRLNKPFLSYIPGGNGVRIPKNLTSDMRNNLVNSIINNNNNNNRLNLNDFRGNRGDYSDNGPPNNSNDNNGNDNPNNEDNCEGGGGGGGMPEKFTRPGCVLSLENVPYKAQLGDILYFFQGYDLTPEDIIRRFNDDGSPTGDARVAFSSPDEARNALETKRRRKMYGRSLYMKQI